MISIGRMESRRAIEALRAGVPNQDAVRALGIAQPALEEQFRKQLKDTSEGFDHGIQGSGMLVSADFGSGKSHLLEYFKHIALHENFVCSKVVISKETPLYDPAKLFRAAIETATVPGKRGNGLTEIVTSINFNSEAYVAFFKKLQASTTNLCTWFAASSYLYEYAKGDSEILDRIVRFWSGDRLSMSELKQYLRNAGEAATYKIDKVPARELAVQRYCFTPQLIRAAGYSGWVILIDEAELLGRYSLRQRARSYAELAKLMGKLETGGIPGLTCVFAIAADFESAVLDYRNDEEKIISKFSGDENQNGLLATQAACGMKIIRREKSPLIRLNPEQIYETYNKLRSVYSAAYGWESTSGYVAPDITNRIRQHIKRWITEWDLQRLYTDYQPQIITSELKQDYEEQPDLEQPEEEANVGANMP